MRKLTPFDFKTANISLRVTPSHKAAMEERAEQNGLDMTEYIGFLFEHAEKEADNMEEAMALRQQNVALQLRLAAFEQALEPLASKMLGKEMALFGERRILADKAELLNLIVKTFKMNER